MEKSTFEIFCLFVPFCFSIIDYSHIQYPVYKISCDLQYA